MTVNRRPTCTLKKSLVTESYLPRTLAVLTVITDLMEFEAVM